MQFQAIITLFIASAFATPMPAEKVGATGAAANSPGFLSGNLPHVPAHVPVNACGLSVNVIGALNPAFGNSCKNESN